MLTLHATPSNPTHSFLKKLQSPALAIPVFSIFIGSAIFNLLRGSEFLSLASLMAIALVLPEFLDKVLFPLIARQTGTRPMFVFGICIGIIGSLAIFSGVHPADAQMFFKAENWIKNDLLSGLSSAGTNTNLEPVKAIFAFFVNIIRFLFILYLGISLVGIIQALKRDEEWGKLAQVPLMVLIASILADIATGFILGNK